MTGNLGENKQDKSQRLALQELGHGVNDPKKKKKKLDGNSAIDFH